jgi:hypothetical protein
MKLYEKENSHDKRERSSTVDKEIVEYLNRLLGKKRSNKAVDDRKQSDSAHYSVTVDYKQFTATEASYELRSLKPSFLSSTSKRRQQITVTELFRKSDNMISLFFSDF